MLQFTNFKGLNWIKFSQSELDGPWEALWARETYLGPRTGIVDSVDSATGAETFVLRLFPLVHVSGGSSRLFCVVFLFPFAFRPPVVLDPGDGCPKQFNSGVQWGRPATRIVVLGDDAGFNYDMLEVGSSGSYQQLPFLGMGQHRVHIVEADVYPSSKRENPLVESSEAFLPRISADPFSQSGSLTWTNPSS